MRNAITQHRAHTFGAPFPPPCQGAPCCVREGSSHPRSRGKDAAPGVAPFPCGKSQVLACSAPSQRRFSKDAGHWRCRDASPPPLGTRYRARVGGISSALRAGFWGALNPKNSSRTSGCYGRARSIPRAGAAAPRRHRAGAAPGGPAPTSFLTVRSSRCRVSASAGRNEEKRPVSAALPRHPRCRFPHRRPRPPYPPGPPPWPRSLRSARRLPGTGPGPRGRPPPRRGGAAATAANPRPAPAPAPRYSRLRYPRYRHPRYSRHPQHRHRRLAPHPRHRR